MARPFMTPEAMLLRRQLAVQLHKNGDLTYREIGALLGCSHTAVRGFVNAPEKPLKWDRKATKGRAWDEASAQERCGERVRRKLGVGEIEYAKTALTRRAITVKDLGEVTPEATVIVPDARFFPEGRREVEWATPAMRERLFAYLDADPRRRCTTTALIAHCRLVEFEDDPFPVRPTLEAVLREFGCVLGADGGWRRG